MSATRAFRRRRDRAAMKAAGCTLDRSLPRRSGPTARWRPRHPASSHPIP
jgi:hypothetical protein